MTNDLVVIQTFTNEFEANIALSQLQSAGIQAILLSEGGAVTQAGFGQGFGLAVSSRDAERATDLLTPPPSPA